MTATPTPAHPHTETCPVLCTCGADAHPVVRATFLGLEPIA